MTVPTRDSWRKMRDAAGVPTGFGKHDMGPAFDKYIAVEQKGTYKERYAAVVTLRKLCLEYYSDLVKSKDKNVKAFATLFDKKIYSDLLKTEAAYKEMANPTLKLKTQLTRLIQSAATVKDNDTWAAWWSGPIRGVGTMRKFIEPVIPPGEMHAFNAAFPIALTDAKFLDAGKVDAKAMAACMKTVLKAAADINTAAHQYGWW